MLYLFRLPVPGIAGCVDGVLVNFHRKPQFQGTEDRQAWMFVSSQNLPMPPGLSFKCFPQGPGNGDPNDKILLLSKTDPTLSGQYVAAGAPMGGPYGNGGNITQAPQSGIPIPAGTRMDGRKDPFESIDPLGLPANAGDGLIDIDPSGGTFTDIDQFGNETKRPDVVPYDATRGPFQPGN